MQDSSTGQIVLIAVIAALFLVVLPRIQSRTGKSMSELLLGINKKKEKQGEEGRTAEKSRGREPKQKNGTQGDLTIFVSQLLKFAGKNGMSVVAPGMGEYQGKTALLVALLVAPHGVTGIHCVGFGGTITPGEGSKPWNQHMNGKDLMFTNPRVFCQEQYDLVRAAMDEEGINGDLNIVTVFTNPRVNLLYGPSDSVFTQKQFMEYLKNTELLKTGDLDVADTTRILAKLAKIQEKRASRGRLSKTRKGEKRE